MRHATFLNLLLGDHGLVNLLRLGIHLGFGELRLAFVASISHPLLLPLESLHEDVVRPIEAELLEPLVHLLYLLATQHVVTCLLINSANELGVSVAGLCLWTNTESENCRQIHSQVLHYDTLAIVRLIVFLTIRGWL